MCNRKFIVVASLVLCYANLSSAGPFGCLKTGCKKTGKHKSNEVQIEIPNAPPKVTRHPYEIISDYLEENIQTEDIDANLNAAAELLEHVKTTTEPEDFKLVKALFRFVDLRDVVTKIECSDNELNLLAENELYRMKDRDPLGGQTRADRILQGIFLNHARYCDKVYAKRFDDRVKSSESNDYDLKEPIKSMLDKWVKIRQADASKKLDFKTILRFEELPIGGSSTASQDEAVLTDFIESQLSPNELKDLARPGHKKFRKEIAKLLDKELIWPCRKFVRFYSQELFDAAYFDYRWLSRLANQEPSTGERDLLGALANYNLCFSLGRGRLGVILGPVTEKLMLKY